MDCNQKRIPLIFVHDTTALGYAKISFINRLIV